MNLSVLINSFLSLSFICTINLVLTACGEKNISEGNIAEDKNYILSVDSATSSLITEDHVSEGFLIKNHNSIEHIYRTDHNEQGDHIGNDSAIYSRVSYDSGTTWETPKLMYQSDFDDRNIHGGKLESGETVIFFRRYNASQIPENRAYGIGYFLRNNQGKLKGPLWINTSLLGGPGSDTLTFVPGRGYMLSLNGQRDSNIELIFSESGLLWYDDIEYLYFSGLPDVSMNESSFVYTKDGIIIGLVRNLSGNNYFQVTSKDYGVTWSQPELSNIGSTYNVVGPTLFYDKISELVIVLASDRRKPYQDQGINVYATNIAELSENGFQHQFHSKVPNIISNEMYFYGYPTSVELDSGSYLVVFTDRRKDIDGTEFANFYQFKLRITND